MTFQASVQLSGLKRCMNNPAATESSPARARAFFPDLVPKTGSARVARVHAAYASSGGAFTQRSRIQINSVSRSGDSDGRGRDPARVTSPEALNLPNFLSWVPGHLLAGCDPAQVGVVGVQNDTGAQDDLGASKALGPGCWPQAVRAEGGCGLL